MRTSILWIAVWICAPFLIPSLPVNAEAPADGADEFIDDPYIAVPPEGRSTSPGTIIVSGPHVSLQINLDAEGRNIIGDAANEPSIAVDPTNPQRMAIGWRQFDTVASNFRQAGYGFSTDGGASWSPGAVIEPGVWRSDPVLDFDAHGAFFYNSFQDDATCKVFRSDDGGAGWGEGVFAFGGDKLWMSIDRNPGIGQGNIYSIWWGALGCCFPNMFNRSTDNGASFEAPIAIGDGLRWGTTHVGPDSAVYAVGHFPDSLANIAVAKSTTAADPQIPLAVDFVSPVDLGGPILRNAGPNPQGALSQIWIDSDPEDANHLYVLSSIDPAGADPLDIHFARSLDGGVTWSPWIRINDDPVEGNAWQWFGMLSVAPNGRLDAIWNDTRDAAAGEFHSVLYYSSSHDGGETWSTNEPLTPAWDPHLGYPNQDKIGDYYEMISTNDVVHVSYAATFNGEQDIYYLPLRAGILFSDDFESGDLMAWSGFVTDEAR